MVIVFLSLPRPQRASNHPSSNLLGFSAALAPKFGRWGPIAPVHRRRAQRSRGSPEESAGARGARTSKETPGDPWGVPGSPREPWESPGSSREPQGAPGSPSDPWQKHRGFFKRVLRAPGPRGQGPHGFPGYWKLPLGPWGLSDIILRPWGTLTWTFAGHQ